MLRPDYTPKLIQEAFIYPGRLTWLAMDGLGKYVSSLFRMLVEKKDDRLVKEVCDHLQVMLHDQVPKRLDEELKIRILRQLENTYIEMTEKYASQDEYHEIAVDLFVAIVHESATSIECAKQTGHLDLLDAYRMKYLDIIYSALPRLKNLKVLRLSWSRFLNRQVKIESFPPNLEECRLSHCSAEEMATLSESCKELKVLDIQWSDYMDCINGREYIVQLESLEEFHTDWCEITYNGYVGFECKKRPSGKYASEFIKILREVMHESRLEGLPRYFPNLTSLTLCEVNYDLTPLKHLSHLEQLSVETEYYCHIRNLFSSIGSQFTCLSLHDIGDIDLEHVAENCTSVNCLHLIDSPHSYNEYGYPFYDFSRVINGIKLPTFPKVTELELDYREDDGTMTIYMMYGFINVRKLLLNVWSGVDDVLNEIINYSDLKKLEEVIFTGIHLGTVTLQFFERYVVITDFMFSGSQRSVPLQDM